VPKCIVHRSHPGQIQRNLGILQERLDVVRPPPAISLIIAPRRLTSTPIIGADGSIPEQAITAYNQTHPDHPY
jgi:hypothetical protein